MSTLAGLHDVLALNCPWILDELADFDFVVDTERKTVRFLDRKGRQGVVSFVRAQFLDAITPACEVLLGPGAIVEVDVAEEALL